MKTKNPQKKYCHLGDRTHIQVAFAYLILEIRENLYDFFSSKRYFLRKMISNDFCG